MSNTSIKETYCSGENKSGFNRSYLLLFVFHGLHDWACENAVAFELIFCVRRRSFSFKRVERYDLHFLPCKTLPAVQKVRFPRETL